MEHNGAQTLSASGRLSRRPPASAKLLSTTRSAASRRAARRPQARRRTAASVRPRRLLMRRLTGVGTPRSLQGRAWTRIDTLIDAFSCFWSSVPRYWTAG